MNRDSRALNYKQTEWAYKKWCDRYTLEEIGDALNCDHKTVRRSFGYYGFNIEGRKRKKGVLVYDG